MADLKPCPFCGGEADHEQTMDESLWSHETVPYRRVRCRQCDIGTDYVCEGYEPTEVEQWNRRATDGQRDTARGVPEGAFIPRTAEQMIEFIGSNFDSMQADEWTDEPIPEPAGDLNNVRYSLTVHDLLSAFQWAGLLDAPTRPDGDAERPEPYVEITVRVGDAIARQVGAKVAFERTYRQWDWLELLARQAINDAMTASKGDA
ncbi:Lar family restriction alleviation protein [Cupriavidus sp. DB3]|uniref:Lar family restriction alleviation protein n=1 Tax=Cupriavidus sp. DB3 TaxID=2873259 RepID=UPI001CF30F6B|nr:Lar family restriction alleviation protein [Cupriavidus sp. DB3]MCA7086095.1 Lar family restriction alleviation protein [Cupriavidus sp. DB3]